MFNNDVKTVYAQKDFYTHFEGAFKYQINNVQLEDGYMRNMCYEIKFTIAANMTEKI